MGRKNRKANQRQRTHRDKYASVEITNPARKKAKSGWIGTKMDVLDIAREVLNGTYYCVGRDTSVTSDS